MWQRAEERQGLLALASRFWQGLAALGATLGDTRKVLLGLVEVSPDPEAVRARLETMQVRLWGAAGGALEPLWVQEASLGLSCEAGMPSSASMR